MGLFAGAMAGGAERSGDALPGIVFVSDDVLGPHHLFGPGRVGTSHWREGYIFPRGTSTDPRERTTTPPRPGRNLYTLIPARPDGTLRRITHLTTGEVFGPEPSRDGRRLLFSMRRDGEDWFNLYEIGADGRNLVPLTDGPFNDVSGVYLPDGRIVFVSDRAGYLDEYHEERTEPLWIMEADGTGLQQLTFNPGTVFDPTVLRDGRILFALWDAFHLNVPPLDKHEAYLMTVRPDGTDESHFFGAGQHRFFSRERHSGVGFGQAREMPDGQLLVLSELGPALLDPRPGNHPERALRPIFHGTTTVQLGGATHRVHLSPTGSRTTPYPLPDGRFLFSATQPGARDLGIYVADPRTRAVQLVFDLPDTAEFDARPILWERPPSATLASRSAAGSPEPAPAAATTGAAPAVSDLVAVTDRARFLVVDGRQSDNPAHTAALARARYFRVIEALPTAVTSSSHTNLATRILGVVPILADGSAFYEAPADTPLYLQPLDAAQRPLAFDWNGPETSVPVGSPQNLVELAYVTARPGETKSCRGCHAPQQQAAPARQFPIATAREPTRIERDVTDILFRRNEPDEYRSGARLGDEAQALAWLSSPHPDVRRRGCEVIMELEDAGRSAAASVARLLSDPVPEVRRSAALALTRLGGPGELPALARALDDRDWQVRFHAAAALETITACVPPDGGRADDGAGYYRRLLVAAGGASGLRSVLERGPAALETWGQAPGEMREARWFEAVGRLGPTASESVRPHVRRALGVPLPPPFDFAPVEGKRRELLPRPPPLGAIRAAGWMRDQACVPLLTPWLTRPEYQDHAREAAVALGRIGTDAAIASLWHAIRQQVPNRTPYLARYFQHGPRPEEYSYVRGLVLAGARPALNDVPWLIALLPGTFLEKPRFEDRLRPETQRILLVRQLLENGGWRAPAVELLAGVLRAAAPPPADPLHAALRDGINLERPFSEHQRPFPRISSVAPEQALWLLGCLVHNASEVPPALVAPFLSSANWRERIDAAVLLHRIGLDAGATAALAREAAKPYPFSEIESIGKGRADPNFRDKSYFAMALARHAPDVAELETLADPRIRYRDLRYGLAVGLGARGRSDGMALLAAMATRDPIAIVRRQARESLRFLQQAMQQAGQPVPVIRLPEPQPFAAGPPSRGLTWPEPLVVPPRGRESDLATNRAGLEKQIEEGLQETHYRNLNNSNNQAPGATRMMVRGSAALDRAVTALVAHHPAAAPGVLRRLLESPYPFAHYLGARELLAGGFTELNPLLVERLEAFARLPEPVGFYWTCEAVARRGVGAALPILVRHAHAKARPGLHGPVGMGLGYPAAKAIAWLAGAPDHPEVQRLLHHDNAWLRAGALAGLCERSVPGLEPLLASVLAASPSALVADQAEAGRTASGSPRPLALLPRP